MIVSKLTTPIATALFCLLATAASAREIYVAPNGNDSPGAGSISSPFRTVQAAVDDADPRDTITLRSGRYPGAVRVRRPEITIRSRPGEWGVIEAPTNDLDITEAVMFDVDASGGRLERLEIIGGSYYAVFLQTKWDWDYSVPFDERYGASRITIEDCRIHGSGRDCIKITPACDDVTIRRCEIYESGRRDPGNAEGIDNVNADRMLVQDCYIHDIATSGLYPKGGATGCVIERNLIVNCGDGGILLGFDDTDFDLLDTVANPRFFDNLDCTVRNNIIVNTGYAGIALWASQNARVYNNTLVDVARIGQAGILVSSAHHYEGYRDLVTPNVNPTIVNNIVVVHPSGQQPAVEIREEGLSGPIVLAGNRYFRKGGTRFVDDREPNYYDGDLAGWQRHISGDAGSSVGEPSLDAGYHLMAGSPCIDAGSSLSDASDDYDGNARAGTLDIGADESGASALQVPPPAGSLGTGRQKGTRAAVVATSYDGNVEAIQVSPSIVRNEAVVSITADREEYARVTVVDGLGQEMEILFEGIIPEGRSSFVWNPREISSGRYYCRIEEKKGTKVAEVVVMK